MARRNWAGRHASVMQEPSNHHPAQLQCFCSEVESWKGHDSLEELHLGISLSTCNLYHFGESDMPMRYSPSTSAKLPQTRAATLALGSEVMVLPDTTRWTLELILPFSLGFLLLFLTRGLTLCLLHVMPTGAKLPASHIQILSAVQMPWPKALHRAKDQPTCLTSQNSKPCISYLLCPRTLES